MRKGQKKIITTKYPRTLADTETKSRRSYPADIHVTPETDRDFLTNPAAFSLQNVYPYVFDGLTAFCTDHFNTSLTFEGKEIMAIQGQNEPALTHFQAIVPVDVFKELCLDGHNEYWHFLETELHRMHKEPELRLLPFTPGYLIRTHPLFVDFVYEDGTKASVMKSLENIGADRKIKYLILHFYKPLFSSILQKNKKGTIGNNYIQMPRAFQAKIAATLKELEARFKSLDIIYPSGDDVGARFMKAIVEKFNNEKPDGWTYVKPLDYKSMFESVMSLSAIEARNIFLFFACHDDRLAEHINIYSVYDDFVMGCFPGLVEKRKKGNIYIKPENEKLINKKLEGFTYLCNFLGIDGKMNGAQFLPLFFDFQNKRIKVQRNKYLCYNNQPELNFTP
jgi:hypothetical protein